MPEALAQFLPQIFSAAIGGVSVYAAIRADLAALHARVANLERACDQAHSRIDSLLNRK